MKNFSIFEFEVLEQKSTQVVTSNSREGFDMSSRYNIPKKIDRQINTKGDIWFYEDLYF